MKATLPHKSGGEVATVPVETTIDRSDARTSERTGVDMTPPRDSDDPAESTCRCSNDVGAEHDSDDVEPVKTGRSSTRVWRDISWSRVAAYAVLPGLALLIAVGAGFLKWQEFSARSSALARTQSVATARDATVALLSYQSDSVEQDIGGVAEERLTGAFKDSYSQLIHDVVIPGARQHHISTTVTVPAAASVSATPNHAVVLVFLNQTVVVGSVAPSESGSSVRVTLDKVDGRWLISGFEPV